MLSAHIKYKTIRGLYNAVRARNVLFIIFLVGNGHKISARIGDRNELLDVPGNLFYYTCVIIHVYKYLYSLKRSVIALKFRKTCQFFPTIYHFIGLRNGHKKTTVRKVFFLRTAVYLTIYY